MGYEQLLNFTVGQRQLYLYRSMIIGCTNSLHKPSSQTEIFTANPELAFIVDEHVGTVVKKLKGEPVPDHRHEEQEGPRCPHCNAPVDPLCRTGGGFRCLSCGKLIQNT